MSDGRQLGLALQGDHPSSIAFLDETGAIAKDKFFAVGCLKLSEPCELTRRLQKLRDFEHWYEEIHFTDLTRDSFDFYRSVVDIVATSEGTAFSCVVSDIQREDPVVAFGSPWKAYEMLATELLVASVADRELITVLADNYSTPDEVTFEKDVKAGVNRHLDRLAVVSVCRLDSKAADPLQVADLLTGAVAFEFRASAGLAKVTSTKARLARHVREAFGVETFLDGFRSDRIRVELFGGGSVSPLDRQHRVSEPGIRAPDRLDKVNGPGNTRAIG